MPIRLTGRIRLTLIYYRLQKKEPLEEIQTGENHPLSLGRCDWKNKDDENNNEMDLAMCMGRWRDGISYVLLFL